jgi:hypothetical protein
MSATNLARTELRIEREQMLRAALALQSPICLCGGEKPVKMAVCRACWDELPLRYHRGLYRRLRCGFEEAYEGARVWLYAARGIGMAK